MKTNYKRKNGKKSAVPKKSYFASVKFLITAFACVFFILGAFTINALAASPVSGKNLNNKNEPDYTSFFDFKNGNGQTITMTLNEAPATDLLAIDTDKAITGFLITTDEGTPITNEACVYVSVQPFAIKPLKVGEARVYVTARLQNNTLCQRWIKIIIQDKNLEPIEKGQNNHQDETSSDLQKAFKLICNITLDLPKVKELDFFVLCEKDNTQCAILSLRADILQGNVLIDITGYTATISFISANNPCTVKFTALFAEGNAEFLFVNSAV